MNQAICPQPSERAREGARRALHFRTMNPLFDPRNLLLPLSHVWFVGKPAQKLAILIVQQRV
jgi:hypothetical protein